MAAIYNGLSKLYGDEKYADLTVTCGERTFRLHRAIICSQSPIFETACSGGFRESTTGRITIEEVDPDILAKFVEFIYTGNYADEDHLNSQVCDEAILEPVEDLIASLRHGTNIPGLDWYDMKLWEDTVPKYLDDSILLCRCGTCICLDTCDPDGSAQCEYISKQRRNRCLDGDSSSKSESSYVEEWDPEDDDDDWEDGDPGEYMTELPHSMFTSVRVYAVADMFGVPALQVLARNRFYKTIEKNVTGWARDEPRSPSAFPNPENPTTR
ncbi:hypothetical protein VTI28DRAFT_1693 [Corynascus sepedonium]